MKIKNTLTMVASLAILIAATGCSEDSASTDASTGNGTLNIIGTVKEMKTRATGTGFENGDAIGVSLDTYKNYKYTADGTGRFTGDEILVSGTQTLTAYYPYNEEVTGETPTIDFATPADYLWVEKGELTKANCSNVSLAFSHVMTKITFTITTPEGSVTENTECKIRLMNVLTAGTFNTSTGEVTASGGARSTEYVDFTPGSPTGIIVVPQNLSGAKVSIIFGSKYYEGSITDLSTVVSGNQYNFAIQLLSGDMIISSTSITEFNGADDNPTDLTVQETDRPIEYRTTEAEVAIGDFLMADGSVVNGKTYQASIEQDVIGIVFYVGQEHITLDSKLTPILEKEPFATYKTCTTGLAVALENSNNSPTAFGTTSLSGIWPTWYWEKANSYGYNADNYTKESSTSSTYMFGFNNSEFFTKVVHATEPGEINVQNDVSGLAEAINGFTAYTCPSTASGWYIASFAEMAVLATNYNAVNASFGKLTGKSLPRYDSIDDNYYWCSTMLNKSGAAAHVHTLTAGLEASSQSRTTGSGHFRPIIAFKLAQHAAQ